MIRVDAGSRRTDLLEQENAALRERVAQLESALIGAAPLPLEWRLTPQEQRVFGVLLNRERATKDQIATALYSLDIDGGADPKIVDVFVCKMRPKLKPFGIVIETILGSGYALDPATRSRLRRDLMEAV